MQQLLLFPTVFGHTVIEKNTDELKKNKNFLPSNNNFEFSGRFDRDRSDYHALDKALEPILKFGNYDIMPVSTM